MYAKSSGRFFMPASTAPHRSEQNSRRHHVAVILGAGFSHCASLPTQKDFSRELLTGEDTNQLDQVISRAIKGFLEFAFGWAPGDPVPPLENIFTMIDLSSGTGHALGPRYQPKRLRALRRLLIFRVFSILDRRYKHSETIDQLLKGLYAFDPNTSFVVLNWDIVLERHLEDGELQRRIGYGVNELPWYGNAHSKSAQVKIIKVHGSANWVYCDSCRQIYFDRYRKLAMHIRAGISSGDLRLFDPFWDIEQNHERMASCPECNSPVGPHIATFSYRKSFRTAAFTASWAAAEDALSKADRWLFVGYSLPAADYEFIHLLKTAELKSARSNERPIRMHVVLKDDSDAEARYRQMFGSAIALFERGGLAQYLRTGFDKLGGSASRISREPRSRGRVVSA